jgi:hypothetical protein
VLFVVHPADHGPPHVHSFIADGEVILDLTSDGGVMIADRPDAVRRANRSDVRKVVRIASLNVDDLRALWEMMHGEE